MPCLAMKKVTTYGVWLLCLGVLLGSTGYAQEAEPLEEAAPEETTTESVPEDGEEDKMLPTFFDGFSIGGSFGAGIFYGDLANYYVFPKVEDFGRTFRSVYRGYVQRDIEWGLGARIQFEKGSLKGGKTPGLQAAPVDFRTDFFNISLSAYYDVASLILRKGKPRHYYFDLFVGVGWMGFRSFSFWEETQATKDYVGYVEVERTEGVSQKGLLEKDKLVKAWNMPIGVKFGYQLNHKFDITAEISQVNTFTDELDTWVRDWTARDKYGFYGIGITYNFNRKKDDFAKLPRKGREKRKERKAERLERKAKKDKNGLGLFTTKKQYQQLLQLTIQLTQLQMEILQGHTPHTTPEVETTPETPETPEEGSTEEEEDGGSDND